MRGLSRLAGVLLILATGASAQATESPTALNAGAVEFGGFGSLTTVEGITNGSLGLRGGTFFDFLTGLLGAELGTSFKHVSSQDVFDIETQVSWQKRLRDTSNYPFIAVAAGLRHEEIGSFGSTRYPVGLGIGLRALLGKRSAARFEYQYRRVLNDPIRNFNEHQFIFGLSVFFRNQP